MSFSMTASLEAMHAKTKSPKEWLEKMLESLHENEKENNDNYSAIAMLQIGMELILP